MSIFEYDEEKEMALIRADERRQGLEEGLVKGKKDGIEEGISEGGTKKLISLVCSKLQKGKNPEQIAEDLEEELTAIENIVKAARDIASYNCDEIYEVMKNS